MIGEGGGGAVIQCFTNSCIIYVARCNIQILKLQVISINKLKDLTYFSYVILLKRKPHYY